MGGFGMVLTGISVAGNMDQAIYSILSGYAPLVALVGTDIYATFAPQNVSTPYLVFRGGDPERHSAMGSDTGLVDETYTLEAYAQTITDAKNIIQQVRAVCQRYSGTVGAVVVQQIFMDPGSFDDYDYETELYISSVDLHAWWEETT